MMDKTNNKTKLYVYICGSIFIIAIIVLGIIFWPEQPNDRQEEIEQENFGEGIMGIDQSQDEISLPNEETHVVIDTLPATIENN